MNRVLKILDDSDTYPYTIGTTCTGMACINRGGTDVVVSVGEVDVTIAPAEAYSGEFNPFTSVDVTGSDFNLELRG